MKVDEKILSGIIERIGKRPLVLYGAGKYGRQALENIRKYFPHLMVKYFIDDNRVRNSGDIQGIEIKSLEEVLRELGKDFCILITNYYVPEVLEKIERNHFDLSNVFFSSGIMIEDINPLYLNQNLRNLQKAYTMLDDYKSKMIFREMVEARFTKKIDVLSRTCESIQYFPGQEVFCVGDDEVFVDAGAFDGDTIKQFQEITGGKFKYIYAFEPDSMNCQKLREHKYNGNVSLYQAGLYDRTGTVCFSGNQGGSSKIEVGGGEEVDVYRFDELDLPEKGITFVKMDIEGSERKALEGMRQAIREHKPKLAICMYHKFEDLWELPLYIKELVAEYKLYIRNYTTYLDEVVLYATI